jgi:MFS family permease
VALSINFLVGGASGFVVGTLADRYGPRALLATTAALAGTGFALVSTVHALWHFYLLVGVLGGVGMSAFYVLSTSTVARWFDARRGLAMGIVLTGFNLGYVAGSPAAAWLIEHVGWRAAYAILGGSCGVIGSLAALAVRYPRPAAPGDRAAPARPSGQMGTSLREALRDSRLWCLNASWLLMGLVLTMLSVHIVPYARDRGIDLEQAALALTAYGVGSVGGRLVLGAASDRLGTTFTMRLCFAADRGADHPLLAPSARFLPLVMAAFGFGFAGADTVIVHHPRRVGLRARGHHGCPGPGCARGGAGPAAAGFIYDLTRSCVAPSAPHPSFLASLFLVTVTAPGGGASQVNGAR